MSQPRRPAKGAAPAVPPSSPSGVRPPDHPPLDEHTQRVVDAALSVVDAIRSGLAIPLNFVDGLDTTARGLERDFRMTVVYQPQKVKS